MAFEAFKNAISNAAQTGRKIVKAAQQIPVPKTYSWSGKTGSQMSTLEKTAYLRMNSDKESARDAFKVLSQEMQSVNSRHYSPYLTGKSNQKEAMEFFGVDSFDQNWLDNNRFLLKYTSQLDWTDTISTSGQAKWSDAQKAGYYYHMLSEAEQTTQQAEQEWANLRTDMQKNFNEYKRLYGKVPSYDQLMGYINMSDYSTLQKMDKVYDNVEDIVRLNRSVNYSPETVLGVYAALVNGKDVTGEGNYFEDAVQYTMQPLKEEQEERRANYSGWTKEQIEAKRQEIRKSGTRADLARFEADLYASTPHLDSVDSESYFSETYYDQNFFDKYAYLGEYAEQLRNRDGKIEKPSASDPWWYGAAYEYSQIEQREEATRAAEQEWTALRKDIQAASSEENSPEDVLNSIDWEDYPTLEKIRKGQDVGLNRAIYFSDEAILGVLRAAADGEDVTKDDFDYAFYESRPEISEEEKDFVVSVQDEGGLTIDESPVAASTYFQGPSAYNGKIEGIDDAVPDKKGEDPSSDKEDVPKYIDGYVESPYANPDKVTAKPEVYGPFQQTEEGKVFKELELPEEKTVAEKRREFMENLWQETTRQQDDYIIAIEKEFYETHGRPMTQGERVKYGLAPRPLEEFDPSSVQLGVFEPTGSIFNDTYNQIAGYYENPKTGKPYENMDELIANDPALLSEMIDYVETNPQQQTFTMNEGMHLAMLRKYQEELDKGAVDDLFRAYAEDHGTEAKLDASLNYIIQSGLTLEDKDALGLLDNNESMDLIAQRSQELMVERGNEMTRAMAIAILPDDVPEEILNITDFAISNLFAIETGIAGGVLETQTIPFNAARDLWSAAMMPIYMNQLGDDYTLDQACEIDPMLRGLTAAADKGDALTDIASPDMSNYSYGAGFVQSIVDSAVSQKAANFYSPAGKKFVSSALDKLGLNSNTLSAMLGSDKAFTRFFAKAIDSAAGSVPWMLRSMSDGAQRARDMGASEADAIKYGIYSGGTTGMIEGALGQAYDSLLTKGSNLISKGLSAVTKGGMDDLLARRGVTFVTNMLQQAFGEGLEEAAEMPLDKIGRSAFLGEALKFSGEDAKETWENMKMGFVSSLFTSAFFGLTADKDTKEYTDSEKLVERIESGQATVDEMMDYAMYMYGTEGVVSEGSAGTIQNADAGSQSSPAVRDSVRIMQENQAMLDEAAIDMAAEAVVEQQIADGAMDDISGPASANTAAIQEADADIQISQQRIGQYDAQLQQNDEQKRAALYNMISNGVSPEKGAARQLIHNLDEAASAIMNKRQEEADKLAKRQSAVELKIQHVQAQVEQRRNELKKEAVEQKRKELEAARKKANDLILSLYAERRVRPGVRYVSDVKQNKIDAVVNAELEILDALGKEYGIEFDIVDSLMEGRANAAYGGGRRIIVAMDAAESAFIQAAVHEMTHMIRAQSVDGYNSLKTVVLDQLKKEGSFDVDKEAKKRIAEYAESGVAISMEQAIEEIVAEAVPTVLSDANAAARLVKKNPTLVERISNFFRQFADKLKAITMNYADKTGRTEVKGLIGKAESLYEIADALDNALNMVRNEYSSDGKSVRFSLKNSVERVGNLVAVHNLSEANVVHSMDQGWMAALSVGITKANQSLEFIGDVSFVFRAESVDPEAHSGNRVYDRDAYTGRYPKTYNLYRTTEGSVDRVSATADKIGDMLQRRLDKLDKYPWINRLFKDRREQRERIAEIKRGIEDAFDTILYRLREGEEGYLAGISQKNLYDYLALNRSTGALYELETGKKATADGEQYREYVNSLLGEAIVSAGPVIERVLDGARFEVTPENLVSVMDWDTEKAIDAEELAPSSRGYMQLGTLDKIRSESDRIAPGGNRKGRDKVNRATHNLLDDIMTYQQEGAKRNDAYRAMLEFMRLDEHRPEEAQRIFEQRGFKLDDEDADYLSRMAAFNHRLETPYFEAKLMREVGFDEVVAAIVPSDMDQAQKERLAGMIGGDVIEYTRGDDQARLNALNGLEGVRFSLKNNRGERLADIIFGAEAEDPYDYFSAQTQENPEYDSQAEANRAAHREWKDVVMKPDSGMFESDWDHYATVDRAKYHAYKRVVQQLRKKGIDIDLGHVREKYGDASNDPLAQSTDYAMRTLARTYDGKYVLISDDGTWVRASEDGRHHSEQGTEGKTPEEIRRDRVAQAEATADYYRHLSTLSEKERRAESVGLTTPTGGQRDTKYLLLQMPEDGFSSSRINDYVVAEYKGEKQALEDLLRLAEDNGTRVKQIAAPSTYHVSHELMSVIPDTKDFRVDMTTPESFEKDYPMLLSGWNPEQLSDNQTEEAWNPEDLSRRYESKLVNDNPNYTVLDCQNGFNLVVKKNRVRLDPNDTGRTENVNLGISTVADAINALQKELTEDAAQIAEERKKGFERKHDPMRLIFTTYDEQGQPVNCTYQDYVDPKTGEKRIPTVRELMANASRITVNWVRDWKRANPNERPPVDPSTGKVPTDPVTGKPLHWKTGKPWRPKTVPAEKLEFTLESTDLAPNEYDPKSANASRVLVRSDLRRAEADYDRIMGENVTLRTKMNYFEKVCEANINSFLQSIDMLSQKIDDGRMADSELATARRRLAECTEALWSWQYAADRVRQFGRIRGKDALAASGVDRVLDQYNAALKEGGKVSLDTRLRLAASIRKTMEEQHEEQLKASIPQDATLQSLMREEQELQAAMEEIMNARNQAAVLNHASPSSMNNEPLLQAVAEQLDTVHRQMELVADRPEINSAVQNEAPVPEIETSANVSEEVEGAVSEAAENGAQEPTGEQPENAASEVDSEPEIVDPVRTRQEMDRTYLNAVVNEPELIDMETGESVRHVDEVTGSEYADAETGEIRKAPPDVSAEDLSYAAPVEEFMERAGLVREYIETAITSPETHEQAERQADAAHQAVKALTDRINAIQTALQSGVLDEGQTAAIQAEKKRYIDERNRIKAVAKRLEAAVDGSEYVSAGTVNNIVNHCLENGNVNWEAPEVRARGINAIYDKQLAQMKARLQKKLYAGKTTALTVQDVAEIIGSDELTKSLRLRYDVGFGLSRRLHEMNEAVQVYEQQREEIQNRIEEEGASLELEAERGRIDDELNMMRSRIENGQKAMRMYFDSGSEMSLEDILAGKGGGRLPLNIMNRIYAILKDVDAQSKNTNRPANVLSHADNPLRAMEHFTGEWAPLFNALYIGQVQGSNAKMNAERGSIVNRLQNSGIQHRDAENAMLYAEGKMTEAEFEEKYPNPSDRDRIKRGILEYRKVYDNLFKEVNEALVRNGFDAIPYRKDYIHHMRDAQSGIAKVCAKLGIRITEDELPTAIAGHTEENKPRRGFMSASMERHGDETSYDLERNTMAYVDAALRVIHHTDNISRLRQLEGIMDQTQNKRAVNSGLAQYSEVVDTNDLKRSGRSSKTAFSSMREWVTEYTNLLAGKQSFIDRPIEKLTRRNVLQIANSLKNMTGSSIVVGNLNIATSNILPVMTMAGISPAQTAAALADVVRGGVGGMLEFEAQSDFLTARYANEQFNMNWVDVAKEKAMIPFEAIDRFAANAVVRTYQKIGLKKGWTPEVAMKWADQMAWRMMASTNTGEGANIMSSKMAGILLQFSREGINNLQFLTHDLPEISRGGGDWLKKLLGILIGGWIYNEAFNKSTALDVITPTEQSIREWDTDKSLLSNLGNTVGNYAEMLNPTNLGTGGDLTELPLFSNLSDLGKAGWNMADSALQMDGTGVRDGLTDFFCAMLGFVPGGLSIERLATGIGDYYRGYTTDSAGNIKFTIDNDLFSAGSIHDAIFTLLLSSSGTFGGREYTRSGYQKMTSTQTEAFHSQKATGMSNQEAFDSVNAYAEQTGRRNASAMVLPDWAAEKADTDWMKAVLEEGTEAYPKKTPGSMTVHDVKRDLTDEEKKRFEQLYRTAYSMYITKAMAEGENLAKAAEKAYSKAYSNFRKELEE